MNWSAEQNNVLLRAGEVAGANLERIGTYDLSKLTAEQWLGFLQAFSGALLPQYPSVEAWTGNCHGTQVSIYRHATKDWDKLGEPKFHLDEVLRFVSKAALAPKLRMASYQGSRLPPDGDPIPF